MKNENENSLVMALRLTYQFLSDNGHLNVDQGHEHKDVVPGMTLEEMFRDYNSNQLNIAFKYLVENGQVQIAKGLSDLYPQLKNLKMGTILSLSDIYQYYKSGHDPETSVEWTTIQEAFKEYYDKIGELEADQPVLAKVLRYILAENIKIRKIVAQAADINLLKKK